MESKITGTTDRRYANYVLFVLTIVYVLNFVDRQILSILANDVKRDLHLTDADIGFLFGTAFGVFYSLFGIPLGRLADGWSRVKLMTVGLALWSAMTAFSGLARSGAQLTLARIGVGVGEATASPCAYSLISDYFPKERRATALAIYSSGVFLGGGLSLFLGGAIAEHWDRAYPGGTWGVVGWQAAFMAVGVPGLLVAAWVATLREPERGAMEGIVTTLPSHPFRDFLGELVTIVPPFTLIGAARRGMRALIVNIAMLAVVSVVVAGLIGVTHSTAQWIAVGGGVYAVFSWASALRDRDPPAFRLIWGTPAFLYVTLGYGLIAFVSYGISVFAAPYAESALGQSKTTIGLFLGGGAMAGGFIGVVSGGRIADAWKERKPWGRIPIIMIGSIGPVIPLIIALNTTNAALFYILAFFLQMLGSSALGATAATVQDLALPRMRGTATATFFIGTTMIGLALGPYMAGFVSTVTGSLRTGILSLLVAVPLAALFLILAWRSVPAAEASVIERARAAGEPI
ncbi:MFS transporter [Sphingomonas sp.]|uniref:spinster family MFS transporter n=1 Tax=Sphingomonas sp. TaxID=28214 RepID=UPI0025D51590|nr:MFS transporter [Sphingomonas sp.]